MKAYLYDDQTSEFKGETQLYIDPLETEKAGENVYIKIANSTELAPLPVVENETNVFVDGNWKVIADFRSVEMFYIEDATKVDFSLGDTPTELMTLENPTSLIKPIWDSVSLKWEEDLPIEDVRTNKKKELENSFNEKASLMTTALPHEMASWDKQENQARAWNNDNTVVTPIIDELLIARNFGETKQDLVNKIIGNADAYEVVYGQILGKYQNLISQVDGATTIADVEAIIWG